MAPTVVLITGANRGLGLGLLKRYLSLADHIVIALNRDPSHPTSQALSDIRKGTNTTLVVAKYDANIWQDAFDAVKDLTENYGITYLDVVIANAGMAKIYPFAKDVKREDIIEHLDVNVFGTIAIYQATRELLQKSPTGEPIFAIMGSSAGSLGNQPAVPSAAYGAAKSMLNWYGIRINQEDPWLNTFIIDPGWVQTDTGNAAANMWGLEAAPLTVDVSCDGMFEVVKGATKEKYGGKFVLYTGEVKAW
ncbi:hypothetical protein QBC38DRAFT_377706 [Podospora fimiseda]|uniref:NAD(P)-binding protein n=1 Tax=Podospora fimiseda TaxID=252190 RepID=A0AAN7BCV6_9PEZI|nr:hypothetical protein QBC38DRAFT_377706 [Podospora fimiseda]